MVKVFITNIMSSQWESQSVYFFVLDVSSIQMSFRNFNLFVFYKNYYSTNKSYIKLFSILFFLT